MIRLSLALLCTLTVARAELAYSIAPADQPADGHTSLAKALHELRAHRNDGRPEPAILRLRPGSYALAEPIDPALAGDGLIIEAADPTAPPPVFSAGRRLERWQVTDGLWTAPLDREPAALFVDGQTCPRARMPNDGYWRIEKTGPDRRTSFTWQPDTIPAVDDLAHLDLVFLHDWSISRIPVKSLDHATRTLVTRFPIGPSADHYKIDHYEPQPRFFLEGSRDFLDAPGEWHFNRESKELRYRPRPGEDPAATPAVVTVRPHATILRGSAEEPLKNVRFRHVAFSHADWQPDGGRYAAGQASFHEDGSSHTRTPVACAVEADFCENLAFESCRFTESSGGGLWIRRQCRDVTITNCTFADLGGNGLMIGEPQQRDTVTSNVTVAQSTVTRCGQRFFGAVGIWIGMAADCTVRDGEISQLPYTGISVGWRWNPQPSPCQGHLIANNHIHHILLTLSDGGGIYTLGRQPGTILRGNHIHDVRVNAGRAESNGIFMDEGTTGLVVENNHIHDIARSPVRFHRAGKNTLRHNKLVPKPGVPTLRFNNTPEENITVVDPQ